VALSALDHQYNVFTERNGLLHFLLGLQALVAQPPQPLATQPKQADVMADALEGRKEIIDGAMAFLMGLAALAHASPKTASLGRPTDPDDSLPATAEHPLRDLLL
jgi:hypothetical protein